MKRRRKPKIPKDTRARVRARTNNICARPGCEKRIVQLHHVLDQAHYPELALAEWNLIGVCWQCQLDHHFKPFGNLPRSAIPEDTLKRLRRDQQRWGYVLRHYPDEGPPPTASGPTKGDHHGRVAPW